MSEIKNTIKQFLIRRVWIISTLLIFIIFFLIFNFILSNFIYKDNTSQNYKFSKLEEKNVYMDTKHDIKEDYSYIVKTSKSPLSNLNIDKNKKLPLYIAVSVENYAPIRSHQSGIEDASIVYEFPVEGGITRFLLIYDTLTSKDIGPVRSVRPYILDWASEFSPALIHIGGSNEALKKLSEINNIINVDEEIGDNSIIRNNKWVAPHNAYARLFEVLKKLQKQYNLSDLKTEDNKFKFKEHDLDSGEIKNIAISFSLKSYDVNYVYNPENHEYLRYNGGMGEDYKTSNIIVQFVNSEIIDDVGRLKINSIGKGDALLFRDGKVINAKWTKNDIYSNTKYTLSNGEDITLNEGKTWIEILPQTATIEYN